MDGSSGISCIPIAQVRLREQIHIMKNKYMVTRGVLFGTLERKVESNIEQLPTVEFSTIVGLFNDVNVIILYFARGDQTVQKIFHVGNELMQLLRSILRGVQISIGHDDGNGIEHLPFFITPFFRHALLRTDGVARLRWRGKVPLRVPRLAVVIVGAVERCGDATGPALGNRDVSGVGRIAHCCCPPSGSVIAIERNSICYARFIYFGYSVG